MWLEFYSILCSVEFSSVQLLSHIWLFATPWITAHQASLLFNSIIVPTTGHKSNFIYKTYMTMPLWMYNYYKKKISETFSKSLPSSTNLKTLAEQLADQLSGLDPRRWFQSMTHSIGSKTVIFVIILTIIFVIYRCLHAKLLELNKLQWSEPFLQIL